MKPERISPERLQLPISAAVIFIDLALGAFLWTWGFMSLFQAAVLAGSVILVNLLVIEFFYRISVAVWQRSQQYQQSLLTLRESSLLISSSLNLDQVLQSILSSAVELIKVKMVNIMLIDPDSHSLIMRAHIGQPLEWLEAVRKNPIPVGKSLSGWVAEKGEVLEVLDAASDPRLLYQDLARRHKLTSYLGVPLKFKDKVTGVLNVHTSRPHRFSPEEIEVLSALADHAAVALENVRLHEEAERKRDEAAALAEISKDISSSLDLSAILQKLAAHAQRITKSNLSYIGLHDPGEDMVSVKASIGYQTDFHKDHRVYRGGGAGGLVLETGKPFLTNDYLNDPRFRHEPRFDETAKKEALVSQLIVPILKEDRILGLMWVANRRPAPFTFQDQELLQALASQAAIAIESARQFEEEQRRGEEAEALNDISRDITSILDLDVLLNKICVHSKILIRSDVAYIGVSEGEEVIVKYVTGAQTSLIQGTWIRPGVGLGGKVLETKTPMATRDYLSDPRITPDSHTRANTLAEGIHSQLCVPIFLQERTLGLLWVADRHTRDYDRRDQNTLQQLGKHAAIAIENARLYEEIRQRVQELEEKNQQILITQEELIKAQRLAAIGELGLAVAHEINNPLATLLLQADLISLKSHDLPSDLQRSLNTVKEMIWRMKEIVDRLQDIQSEGTRQIVNGLKMTDLRSRVGPSEE